MTAVLWAAALAAVLVIVFVAELLLIGRAGRRRRDDGPGPDCPHCGDTGYWCCWCRRPGRDCLAGRGCGHPCVRPCCVCDPGGCR